jgi:hypothetical protein
MKISHISHSVVNTPTCKFMLKDVLHVLKAYKIVVSVYRLTKDNHVYLVIHHDFFLVKDQVWKKVLLKGRSHCGVYPIPSPSALKQTLGAFRPTLEQWHNRLGHPSHPIVAQVVNNFNLHFLEESNKKLVCNACQQTKSHQLPYVASQRKS